MDRRFSVGIDLHKTQFTICIIDGDSVIVEGERYEMNDEGYEAFVLRMRKLNLTLEGIVLAIESTSNSRFFRDLMVAYGFKVVVVNTLRFKVVNLSTKKTDKNDARIVYGPISTELYFGTNDRFMRDANAMAARMVLDYDVSDAFNVSAHADAIYEVVSSFDKVILCFGAKIECSTDSFRVYGSSTVSLHRNTDGDFYMKPWETIDDDGRIQKYAGLGVETGISSDSIIDNASVAIDFTGADYSTSEGTYQNLGKVTASVTVKF